ncbi:MAG: hypothetical protein HOG49_39490 [Candidatus Scalindua sp.]|nr:hypothetical protein [Candidatus Scalindua sp.]
MSHPTTLLPIQMNVSIEAIKTRLQNLNNETQKIIYPNTVELSEKIAFRFVQGILGIPELKSEFTRRAFYRTNILESPEITEKTASILSIFKKITDTLCGNFNSESLQKAFLFSNEMTRLEVASNPRYLDTYRSLIKDVSSFFPMKDHTFGYNLENLHKKDYFEDIPIVRDGIYKHWFLECILSRRGFLISILKGLYYRGDKSVSDELLTELHETTDHIRDLEKGLVYESKAQIVRPFERLYTEYETFQKAGICLSECITSKMYFEELKSYTEIVTNELCDYLDMNTGIGKKETEKLEGFKPKAGNQLDDNIFHNVPDGTSKPELLFKALENGNYEKQEKLSPIQSWLIDYLFRNRLDKDKRQFHPREIRILCRLGKGKEGMPSTGTIQTAISKINGLCEEHGVTKIFISTGKNGFHSLNSILECMVKLNPSSGPSPMKR